MLILTRKVDQGIVITGDLSGSASGVATIRVLGVERDRVKIGIEAPDGIVIMREELLNKETSQ